MKFRVRKCFLARKHNVTNRASDLAIEQKTIIYNVSKNQGYGNKLGFVSMSNLMSKTTGMKPIFQHFLGVLSPLDNNALI